MEKSCKTCAYKEKGLNEDPCRTCCYEGTLPDYKPVESEKVIE